MKRRIFDDHEFDKALRVSERILRDMDDRAKGDRALRHDVALRRRLLAEAEKEIRSRELIMEKVLFISYSGTSKKEFNKAKTLGEKMGFRVTTGLDQDVEMSWHLRNAIIKKIRDCAVFLGIWSHDFVVKNVKTVDLKGNPIAEMEGNGPSVWLPLELGIALAEGRPFQLLIREGTHPFFYEKPVPELPHSIYGIDNFEEKIENALSKLLERYNEIIGDSESDMNAD